MTTATVKTWNETNTAVLTKGYEDGMTLEALALDLSKTVASVRSKLVALGLYQKATATKATSKAGKSTKAEVADEIRKYTGKTLAGLETLTVATLNELHEVLVGNDEGEGE